MNEVKYAIEKIRNIALVGHAGCGKTTLTEALLFATKTIDRMGKIEDGNTVSDFEPEEQKRHVSFSTSMSSVEFDDVRVNLVDAPGLFDFELGVHEAARACESAVIVVSARDGLQVGAHKAYALSRKTGMSSMFFVSKTDVENADFYKTLEEIKHLCGAAAFPLVVPVTENGNTVYINVIEDKAYSYKDGKPTEVAMPDTGHRLDGLKTAIYEAVAETDEALFEKYFSGEEFTDEEVMTGLKTGVKTGAITPVLCGSSTKLEALDMMLSAIRFMLPSPSKSPTKVYDADGEEKLIDCDSEGDLLVSVFKTVADPFVGKLSYVKVIHGTLKHDSNVINSRTGEHEKLGKLLFLRGKKQIDTDEISGGDMGAVTKLTSTKTGDTLCAPGHVYKLPEIGFPTPTYSMAIHLKNKNDESKIGSALTRLLEEDCTLTYKNEHETFQQLLSGLGEQHLENTLAKLKNKFGIEATLGQPRVAYRESIRKKVKAEGKHKKQTGGHGQFGHVWIEFEPHEGDGLIFEEKVFGGSVPKNYFPAVEKGLQQAIAHGVLAGYPVVGLKATLLDGSYHPVDSSEMAFKLAASLSYKKGLAEASPVLLEPIGSLKVTVPDVNTGDVMGEVNKRRGRVLGMGPDDDGGQVIEAECPMSEMHDFTTFIRSLTGGRGSYTFEFVRYEHLPTQLEGKVIEDAKHFIEHKDDEE